MIDPRELPPAARAALFQASVLRWVVMLPVGLRVLTRLPAEQLASALGVLLTAHASLLMEVDETRAAAADAELILLGEFAPTTVWRN